jgi:hypothetical protein
MLPAQLQLPIPQGLPAPSPGQGVVLHIQLVALRTTNGMDAPTLSGIVCAKVEVLSYHLNR